MAKNRDFGDVLAIFRDIRYFRISGSNLMMLQYFSSFQIKIRMVYSSIISHPKQLTKQIAAHHSDKQFPTFW